MTKLASPASASISSFVCFSVGGILPMLAAAFIQSGLTRISVCLAMTAAGFAGAGFVAAKLSGASTWISVLRLVVGGLGTVAVNYGIGRALGGSGAAA